MSNANRRIFIAGNWKMNKTVGESLALVRELSNLLSQVRDRIEIAVAPPFTAIHSVAKQLEGTNIAVAGQDLYWEEAGAFTGQVSGPMLREAGAQFVIIGHSERRQLFGETDASVNKKLRAALKAGLVPIVCVGETLQEREAGKTLAVVGTQVKGGLAGFSAAELRSLVIAYEPVWAIGTGKTATSAQAQEVHAAIRAEVAALLGKELAESMRIQYGGSVKPENSAELMGKPDVDGALVGGASLTADAFARIVKAQLG